VMPPIVARLSPTPGWTNGAFGLSLLAPLGGKWDLQASTNLLDWTTLGTLTITNSQMPFLDTSAAHLRQRFYRAVSR
jgi:ABC-type arginine transport system ATPase subunit